MRIALIDPSLFTWPYDSELARALSANGHEVQVYGKPYAVAPDDPVVRLLIPHFYRQLSHPRFKRLSKKLFLIFKGVSHIFGMFSLNRALQRVRPDIIHFQWAPLPFVDRFFVARFRRIAPVILTVHDSSPFNNNPSSRLQQLDATRIWKLFDHLIVHTRHAAEKVAQSGVDSKSISVLAHGLLGTAAEPLKICQSPPADSRTLRVLLFGRIKPYKGTDILIKAVAALPPALRYFCEVRIVGEPAMDLAPLQALIESSGVSGSVSIEPRYVPDAEIGALLSAADVIVLPYREIDASGVLMVSLAAGVPIIASRIGLFAELLKDGVHGRLIEVDDHIALADALAMYIENVDARREAGARVRELFGAIPAWSDIAAATAALYDQLLLQKRERKLASRTWSCADRERARRSTRAAASARHAPGGRGLPKPLIFFCMRHSRCLLFYRIRLRLSPRSKRPRRARHFFRKAAGRCRIPIEISRADASWDSRRSNSTRRVISPTTITSMVRGRSITSEI